MQYSGDGSEVHRCCFEGHLEGLKACLENPENRKQLSVIDNLGMAPFHWTTTRKHWPLAKFLSETMTQKELMFRDHDKNTLMHYACIGGGLEVVKILIKRMGTASLSVLNERSSTPFELACVKERYDVVKFLIEKLTYNQIVCRRTSFGPLQDALDHNRMEIAKLLLATLKPTDSVGALRHACSIKRFEKHKQFALDFIAAPSKARQKLREELGLETQNIAAFFSLVVGLCDGYFTLDGNKSKGIKKYTLITKKSDNVRFFEITTRLPMELQMIICNKIFNSPNDTIKRADLDSAILRMF